jgi:hypothetical protein
MSQTADTEELLRQHTAAQLANELDFFRQCKSEWLPTHRGQFVLIGKQTFGGFHKTYQEALRAGTRMFGLVTPFLIQEVSDRDI